MRTFAMCGKNSPKKGEGLRGWPKPILFWGGLKMLGSAKNQEEMEGSRDVGGKSA